MYVVYYEEIHKCSESCNHSHHSSSQKIKLGTYGSREEATKEAKSYCKIHDCDYINISIIKKR